ncbi:2-amino-4-hydroxy-6-hydroxymethyldihydropteridine diphosphokinase [Candidatus Thioglobus autotrophicus]|jgi:2-amino-4-hydroxy-6-hydroxymethyldihydropteridine diphosphokinase|uniref:2-amino-4-hydroxy-6- hydroxymethyldihydropteridine diphosphokinase n=1 Tax=Candidatus Thioglobus autotrophicus TaxID=1705394 RepID=UPI00299DF95B|nr:2-amino-4-hydroxy-6-hydroxymethyldihydropteridine diphosphokinase [Candidatus Thioglobus autotrophicus]WPE16303.1 2-amino-4-hydroxy-6-hydroxymethyldihydropteridine diphosphokinase [Candidatus Thioglobus autotrophicus]WPE17853.1 2-amino-4-hydroxy-6-hydroxymethyldihydropteridine diphosphokinase [Candidatus Thioglobus autotrophicus]
MAKIHINIGSNQNREANIAGAMDYLRLNFTIIKISDIFESPAEGFDGDDFYNVGVNASTQLSVEDVNAVLKNIEKTFGRDRTQPKFSSRLIDLDLVTYDDAVDADANLPRDDILKYSFVLAPLAQLSGGEIHPLTNQTYQQLWQSFQTDNQFELSQYNIEKILP